MTDVDCGRKRSHQQVLAYLIIRISSFLLRWSDIFLLERPSGLGPRRGLHLQQAQQSAWCTAAASAININKLICTYSFPLSRRRPCQGQKHSSEHPVHLAFELTLHMQIVSFFHFAPDGLLTCHVPILTWQEERTFHIHALIESLMRAWWRLGALCGSVHSRGDEERERERKGGNETRVCGGALPCSVLTQVVRSVDAV